MGWWDGAAKGRETTRQRTPVRGTRTRKRTHSLGSRFKAGVGWALRFSNFVGWSACLQKLYPGAEGNGPMNISWC